MCDRLFFWGLLPLYPLVNVGPSDRPRLGSTSRATPQTYIGTQQGGNPIVFIWKGWKITCFQKKIEQKIIARPPGKRLTMENHHVFHGKIHGLRTSTQWQAFQFFPATPTRKTGYNGWNPRNGETHSFSKHLWKYKNDQTKMAKYLKYLQL